MVTAPLAAGGLHGHTASILYEKLHNCLSISNSLGSIQQASFLLRIASTFHHESLLPLLFSIATIIQSTLLHTLLCAT